MKNSKKTLILILLRLKKALILIYRYFFRFLYLAKIISIGIFHQIKQKNMGTYLRNDFRLKNHHLYSSSQSKKRLSFYPVNLDVKQTEVAANILINEQLTEFVQQPWNNSIPIFNAISASLTDDLYRNKPKISIIFDLHDSSGGNNKILLNNKIIKLIRSFKMHVLIIKLQFDNLKLYPLKNPLPEFIHVLSMPMLLGGSRFHITGKLDFEGNRLFRKSFSQNLKPSYEYDWSWIGAETSSDRSNVFKLIANYKNHLHYFLITREGNLDSNKISIPFSDYICISRKSKICLSLNGVGLWCLKDGELFSNNCFVLRQDHQNINLNPLSPKNGVHWVTFDQYNLINKINYYIENNAEREKIRMAGYQYFYDGIVKQKWSEYYLKHLLEFIKCCDKKSLGDLCVC